MTTRLKQEKGRVIEFSGVGEMKTWTWLLSAAALVACSPAPEGQEPNAIWLHLNAASGEPGYELRVQDEVVELAQLEEALLRHAMAANPELSAEEAREDVRIYVLASPGVPSGVFRELLPELESFGGVGIVAEEAR